MDLRSLPPAKLALFTAMSVVALGACQRRDTPAPTAQADAPAPAAAPAPYVPPTADQLYQLVAPIALFPDKLLAQTLAASVYPDQVMSAQDWLRSNRTLSASDRLQAAAAQPWDPSVKALTAFPDVVDQLAGNGDWTRALGDAYAHDPNQVLDAVQVMRQRAQAQGHLRSTPQQRVQVVQRTVVEPAPAYADAVPPPTRTIVIEPAQPDVVYVPRYDPDVVYGAPVDVYREYRYRAPRPYYDSGDLVTAGLISFGVGVLVGDALDHHHRHGVFGWLEPAPPWHSWGWNNWGVNWNAPPSAPNYVVYRNSVYAPRTTIINNHYDNRSYVHNDYRGTPAPAAPMGGPGGQQAFAAARAPGAALAAAALAARAPAPAFGQVRAQPHAMPQTMPHFTSQMLQAGRPVAALAPPAQRPSSPGTPAAMAAARDPRPLPGLAHAAAPQRTLAMAQPNAPRTAPSMPVPQFHGRPVPQALTPTPMPRAAAANHGNLGSTPAPRFAEPLRHGTAPGMQPAGAARDGFARAMARTPPPRQAMPADAPRAQAWRAPAAEREARMPQMPREAMRAPMPQPRQEQRVARFAPPPRMAAPRPAEPRPTPSRPAPAHHDGHHDHDHHNS